MNTSEPFKKVFSYFNWELTHGFSPFVSKDQREELLRKDGCPIEELAGDSFFLNTKLGRFYFGKYATRDQDNGDINPFDLLDNSLSKKQEK